MSGDALSAFSKIKAAQAKTTELSHILPDAELCLAVDLSAVGVGAVLQQKVSGSWKPISFFFQKLTSTQKRYSTLGRELYAANAAVHHFRHFLEGRRFYIFTDHNPLVGAFWSNSKKYSPTETRHLDYLLQFTSDIGHQKGAENIPVDAMSRTINAIFYPCTGMTEFVKLTKIRVPNSNLDIVCDTSTGKIRPFVPGSFRRVFFSSPYNLSHPGPNASIKLMTEKYIWSRMKSDIRPWARTYEQCQKAKVGRHKRTPVDHFQSPDERFEHVHIDITGPCDGYIYLLTCVDRFSPWCEVFPIANLWGPYYSEKRSLQAGCPVSASRL